MPKLKRKSVLQIQKEDRERKSNERQKESPESKIRRQEANRICQAK